MTNEQIIKALRCCSFGCQCENCPLNGETDCIDALNVRAAKAIEQLTTENTDLRKEIEWKDMVIGIDDDLSVPLHAMENYARAKQLYYWLKGILEEQPGVDARKEVHSYWEKDNTPMGNFICHECGEYPAFDSEGYVLYGYAPDYCPNCGAIMDGGDGE